MIASVSSDAYSFSYPADFIPDIGSSTPVNWKSVFLYPFQLHLSSVYSPKSPREIKKERGEFDGNGNLDGRWWSSSSIVFLMAVILELFFGYFLGSIWSIIHVLVFIYCIYGLYIPRCLYISEKHRLFDQVVYYSQIFCCCCWSSCPKSVPYRTVPGSTGYSLLELVVDSWVNFHCSTRVTCAFNVRFYVSLNAFFKWTSDIFLCTPLVIARHSEPRGPRFNSWGGIVFIQIQSACIHPVVLFSFGLVILSLFVFIVILLVSDA